MQDQSPPIDPEALGSEDTDQVKIPCDSCVNGVAPKGGDAGTTRYYCFKCGGSGEKEVHVSRLRS